MATVLKILGWKAQGFRCPDHEISLEKSSMNTFPVSLVQMPNGTGKTTTLNLLRAALSGAAKNMLPEDIKNLRKHGSNNSKGVFKLSLAHDSRRLTIEMNFDFEEGTVQYSTISNAGNDKGFNPPHDLRKFFRPDFVRFFTFDGELAAHILDKNRTDAQMAIMDLFQLTIFSDLIGAVNDYWDKETQNSGATGQKGYQRRKNRVTKLKNRLDKCIQEREHLLKELDSVEGKLRQKDEKFSDAISQQREYREILTKAEDTLEKSKQQTSKIKDQLLSMFRDPHALSVVFAREMFTLKNSLDRVRLPESVAREFFQELSGEQYCVCGRELDDESRENLLSRARQYLGSENISLLNAIKKDVSDFIDDRPDSHEEQLIECAEELCNNIRNTEILRSNRDRIRAEATHEDPELERVQAEILKLKDEKARIEQKLDKYENSSDSAYVNDTYGIDVLKAQLNKAENDLSEITQTMALKEKRDTLLSILKTALDSAHSSICEELCQECNERIILLMPYNTIRVQSIDKSLKLVNQESGSVGENLSIAYAFLSTLFNRSEHQLPFIVDSPAGPIDLDIRPKVGELVPKLTNQFIAFVISSERDAFLAPLEKAAGNDVQYITLFRKGPEAYEERARYEREYDESTDCFCVSGRDFFMSFHRDEENNNAVQA